MPTTRDGDPVVVKAVPLQEPVNTTAAAADQLAVVVVSQVAETLENQYLLAMLCLRRHGYDIPESV